ncbi:CpaF family protein [Nocardia transvalensis]|uniref:CpaF family protein n=1 Tax=Nocardia transvalensis TaxID=37333 RepID=UPI00189499A1|nr:ATPase, T2SS/T4P/T4SS family [Nocardia transvalensis]MBF6333628.1 Flp pilus assembly complex ATPase component TadA [Nocardia transvalensis]
MTTPPPDRSLSSLLRPGHPNGNGAPPAGPRRDLAALLGGGADLRDYTPPPPNWHDTLDRLAPRPTPPPDLAPSPDPAPPLCENPGEDLRRHLDRALVRRLREDVSKQLSERRRERDAQAADPDNPHVTLAYTDAELEAIGTTLVEERVQQHIYDIVELGDATPSLAEQKALVRAVCDSLFRLGPAQPLVDEPDVENVLHTGGATTVMYGDGRTEQRPPIFANDQEAIDWVVFLANRAPGGGRPFSPANPALRLNLPGNIRLSALGWAVEGGVSIAIRKHLHKGITTSRLVEMQVMPHELADLLTAATLSGCSVIASGPMGVGKTTLVRALAATLPTQTRIGTAELVRELYLHELPDRAPYVVSAEVITGGGERNEFTDALKGRFDLHQILQEFVSQQLDRVIVGEVAGREILAMFKAMQMARGSLSTVHAYTARGAIDRLVTLALEEPGVDETYAVRQVAAHIQLIVQMNTHWARAADGTLRSHRHVSEVAWIEPGEDARPAITILYRRPHPHARPRWGSLPPALRERVEPYGFDPRRWHVFDLDQSSEAP